MTPQPISDTAERHRSWTASHLDGIEIDHTSEHG
jgi:hypothetical protein